MSSTYTRSLQLLRTRLGPSEVPDILRKVRDLLETLSVSVGSSQRALAALRSVLSQSQAATEVEDDGVIFPDTSPTSGLVGLQDPVDYRMKSFSGEFVDLFNGDAGLAETLHFLGLVPV